MTAKKLVNRANARTRWYRGMLSEIHKEKVCPLCPTTMRWHTKPILKRYRGWLITENFNPYKNIERHLLVIGAKHKERLEKLDAQDWSAITHLLTWAVQKFSIKGGGIAMRFGDTHWTGATVSHLHMHLIVPKRARGKTKTVFFPIG